MVTLAGSIAVHLAMVMYYVTGALSGLPSNATGANDPKTRRSYVEA
jgi:hypothetical protein